jgi:hypothetical protein
MNYAESARKRVCTFDEDDSYPSPDDDLGDYVSTYFANDIPQATHPLPNINTATTRLPPGQEHQQDILESATDSWNSLFAHSTRDEYESVAAVAPVPNYANRANQPSTAPTPPTPLTMAVRRLCTLTTLTMEQQNGRIVATPQDRSMARIYHLCDDSGSPCYLADSILSQIRKEIVQNNLFSLSCPTYPT